MQFSSVAGGVRVSTDSGIILGVANTFGQHLAGDEALAQLGYKSDGKGGALALTDADRNARVAVGVPANASPPDSVWAGLTRDDLRAIAKGRGIKFPATASAVRLRELLTA